METLSTEIVSNQNNQKLRYVTINILKLFICGFLQRPC